MKRFTALLVTLFLCMPLANAAKDNNANEFGSFRIVLMVDPLRSTFAGGTEKVSKQKIQQAIAIGALAKDWKVLKELSGRTELTTTVNGKHVAHVMVVYDDTGFEIQYLDSTNLLYTEKQEGSRTLRGTEMQGTILPNPKDVQIARLKAEVAALKVRLGED